MYQLCPLLGYVKCFSLKYKLYWIFCPKIRKKIIQIVDTTLNNTREPLTFFFYAPKNITNVIFQKKSVDEKLRHARDKWQFNINTIPTTECQIFRQLFFAPFSSMHLIQHRRCCCSAALVLVLDLTAYVIINCLY